MTELQLIEFVVTLKSFDDLASFYDDMETPGGDLYIPNRAVDCANRRPISRNTHYMLTFDEAEQLKKDPRVEGITVADIDRMIMPVWTETANFNKSTAHVSDYKNWGLYRVTLESTIAGWGSDGTTNNTATIQINASGKNVDVIIVDGHFNPAHPEYALNADGTGGTRANQFNWFSLNSIASSIDNDAAPVTTSTNYTYAPYWGAAQMTSDNNHGAHVAGTVAGNTQGWARDATIYNISPYGSNPNSVDYLLMWDYIRAFHKTKAVNTSTGVKNPTICNCSFGSSLNFPNNSGYVTGYITLVNYRGTIYTTSTNFTDAQLLAMGIDAYAGVATVPYYSTAVAADVTDAMADGIIVVAAAGNDYSKIDVPGGLDYNNYFYATYYGYLYYWDSHKGCAPGSVPNVVCVGAADFNVTETKAQFSNCGPRVDVYSPGRYIMSSFNTTTGVTYVADPRDSNYIIGKISGTSMASPQVTGLLACLLEMYPRYTQTDIQSYIRQYGKLGKLTDTGGGQGDYTSLQGSTNRYLYYFRERPSDGAVYPKQNYNIRPSAGMVYPRPKIFRYGR